MSPDAASFLCSATKYAASTGCRLGGNVTSAFARSTSSPLSSPFSSRVIRPPAGSAVAFVMFHFVSAAEFRMLVVGLIGNFRIPPALLIDWTEGAT